MKNELNCLSVSNKNRSVTVLESCDQLNV